MKYKVTLNGKTYEVEVEAGKAMLVDEYEAYAPAPVNKEIEAKVLAEAGMDAPVDCRIEDEKRTGEDFAKAKEELGDLWKTEEDVMSYICFPVQAKKYLEDRKAKEENIATYVIEEC